MAGMAQRPPYFVPDHGAGRLAAIDHRRRGQRGDTDAESGGGGIAYPTHHCAQDRHIGGGCQPHGCHSEYPAQRQSGQPEQQKVYIGRCIGQRRGIMVIGTHGLLLSGGPECPHIGGGDAQLIAVVTVDDTLRINQLHHGTGSQLQGFARYFDVELLE